MSLKNAFEEVKEEVLKAGKSVFGYAGEESPNFLWVGEGDKSDEAGAGSLSIDTGEIALNEKELKLRLEYCNKENYHTSDKQLVVYVLAEEVSHYIHTRIKPEDIKYRENLINDLIAEGFQNSANGVIEKMEKLALNETYVESIGKAGQRFVENSIGTFDEHLHEFVEKSEGKIREGLWPEYYKKARKAEDIKLKDINFLLRKIGDKEFKENIDFLSWLFETSYIVTASIMADGIAKYIFKNGVSYLRNILHESDRSIVNQEVFGKTMNKLYPGIGNLKTKSASAYMINSGRY